MSSAAIQAPPLFDFKVVIEQDLDTGAFSAECLQTGAVATADDFNMVLSMIEEVLTSEATLAVETGNFSNLFASPAPAESWYRWAEITATKEPLIRFITLEPRSGPPNIPKKPVQKIEVARAAGQDSRNRVG